MQLEVVVAVEAVAVAVDCLMQLPEEKEKVVVEAAAVEDCLMQLPEVEAGAVVAAVAVEDCLIQLPEVEDEVEEEAAVVAVEACW
jgi:hypothetical protein